MPVNITIINKLLKCTKSKINLFYRLCINSLSGSIFKCFIYKSNFYNMVVLNTIISSHMICDITNKCYFLET